MNRGQLAASESRVTPSPGGSTGLEQHLVRFRGRAPMVGAADGDVADLEGKTKLSGSRHERGKLAGANPEAFHVIIVDTHRHPLSAPRLQNPGKLND